MNLEFVHIPKCGGTTVRKLLDTGTTGHFSVRDFYEEHGFWFSFIRNPFDRIASLYRHQYSRDLRDLKTKDISFENWFYLTLVEDKRGEIHNYKYWNPCYWWTHFEDGTCPLDFIGKQENMEEDWEKLCEKIGKNVILEQHNITRMPRDQVYTQDMKNWMHKFYKKDFDLWYPNLR